MIDPLTRHQMALIAEYVLIKAALTGCAREPLLKKVRAVYPDFDLCFSLQRSVEEFYSLSGTLVTVDYMRAIEYELLKKGVLLIHGLKEM